MIDANINSIVLSRLLQVRISGVNPDTIDEYEEAMQRGEEFPPIVLYDVDDALYLVDGWHRHEATRRLGRKTIKAEVIQGTWEEALAYSRFQANRKNGQRLTRADKQALCETIVTEEKYRHLSDTQLGKLAGVSQPTIAATRRRLGLEKPEFTVGADGKQRRTPKFCGSTPAFNTSPPSLTSGWKSIEQAEDSSREKITQRLTEHLDGLHTTLNALDRMDVLLKKYEDTEVLLKNLEEVMERIRKKHA